MKRGEVVEVDWQYTDMSGSKVRPAVVQGDFLNGLIDDTILVQKLLEAAMTLIRTETTGDYPSIREVLRQAFGREEEGRLVDSLRDGGFARLSLVALEDGPFVGHILFSELVIAMDQGSVPALSLAPLAVLPERQRRGLGSMLVQEGLRLCGNSGDRIVIVLGHPEYYPRFGFSAKLAQPLRSPYAGPAFMALELETGALDGVAGEVRYPPPFETF